MSEEINYNLTKEELATAQFGDAPIHDSSVNLKRDFHTLPELESLVGETLWVRGRCQRVRARGKQAFMVLRQKMDTIQVCAFASETLPKELVVYMGKIPFESIVDIECEVAQTRSPITSCTIQNVELKVKRILTISRSQLPPFSVEDASRPEDDEGDFIRVSQPTRLDNRYIDLRVPSNQAIMRVSHWVCKLFRDYLSQNGFTEIQTPKIQAGASEGGSEVFKFDYFGTPACLAQSPQIHKQLAIVADMGRVFEIGPVFRAENSNTNRHLCEFVGLDLEMEIMDHYHEALRVLAGLFIHIFKGVNEHCQKEMEVVKAQFPFEDLKFPEDPADVLVLTFPEAVAMLLEVGCEQGLYDDLSSENEAKLGQLVLEKYNTDFYILDKYPMAVRPFYTMPDPENPLYSNSYDIFIRGQEVTSGAQRINDYALLAEKCEEKGVPIETLGAYAEAFKYGAPQHAGAGIGLARVVSLILNIKNVKKTCMFPRDPKRLTP